MMYVPAGRSAETGAVTIPLVVPGRSVAETIVDPSNGFPDGPVCRFGTDTIAPKIVPPSAACAYVLIPSTCTGEVNTK